jgi:His/Glu/Gln/Arg/opine family amino acid ABC transporter permease subunit
MVDWAMLITLAGGAVTTIWISSVGIAVGVPLGLMLALIRIARLPVASQLVAVYVSILRATPVVTLALFIFFGVPVMGLTLSPTLAALSWSPAARLDLRPWNATELSLQAVAAGATRRSRDDDRDDPGRRRPVATVQRARGAR